MAQLPVKIPITCIFSGCFGCCNLVSGISVHSAYLVCTYFYQYDQKSLVKKSTPKSNGPFLYTCLCALVCLCMQVRVCAHGWRSEVYIGSFQSCFTLFVPRQDLSLTLEPYDSARLASPQAPMICLCLPTSTGMTSAHQHAWHFRWILRLELRSPCLHFNHFNDRALSSVPTGPILIAALG